MSENNLKALDDIDLWFNGYIAYNYIEIEVNPYPKGTHEYQVWNNGYDAAKKDESRDVLYE